MTINRTLISGILLSAVMIGHPGIALAQICHREGPVVTCDDGRRGMLLGDAVIWPDGTYPPSECHSRQQIVGEGGTRRVRRPGQRRGTAG